MPTIIDSLIVTLGLDASGYKKGSKEVEKAGKDTDDKISKSKKKLSAEEKKIADEQKKRAKEIEARNKSIAQGMNKLRNEALGLLAVFTAGMGIKNFIESTIDSGASLSRMSKNLNMTAKDLAMYKLANQIAGGSAEGMVAQLQQASEDISSLQLGKGLTESAQNTLRYAAMYGVSASLDDMKDATTLLKKRADIIATINKVSPTQAMSVAKAMGISDDTFNLMKLGAAGIELLKQSQEGLAATQARNADRAEAFRQKMVNLKNIFLEAGTSILTSFMPVLEVLVKRLTQLEKWMQSPEARAKIAEWAAKFAKAIDSVADSISKFDWNSMRDGMNAVLQIALTLAKAINMSLEGLTGIKNLLATNVSSDLNTAIGGAFGSPEVGNKLDDLDRFLNKILPAWASVNVPPAPQVGAAASVNRNITSSSNSEVKVGSVTIHTQATDAAGIAKSFSGAMQKYGYPAQANSGIR